MAHTLLTARAFLAFSVSLGRALSVHTARAGRPAVADSVQVL